MPRISKVSEKEQLDSTEFLPVLPLRDVVVYPKMIVPIFVGREKSIEAILKANDKGTNVILVMQKNADIEAPEAKDLYKVGTLGNILQMLKLPDGTIKILVEGIERIKIEEFKNNKTYLSALAKSYPQKADNVSELKPWALALISQFEEYVKTNKKIPLDVIRAVKQIEEYDKKIKMIQLADEAFKAADEQQKKQLKFMNEGIDAKKERKDEEEYNKKSLLKQREKINKDLLILQKEIIKYENESQVLDKKLERAGLDQNLIKEKKTKYFLK
jgi:ATP-dependent Lon protease